MTRARTVLLVVLLGGALFGLSLLTWVRADAATTLGPVPVAVQGSQAAPVAPSAALAVVVAGLALGLSGRVVRFLAAGVAVLAALIMWVAVLAVLRDPLPAARAAAGDVGGVREVEGLVRVTPWPWVVLVLASVTVLLAAVLPLRAGVWAPVARRYERPGVATSAGPSGAERTSRDDWDALTRGDDPSRAEAEDGEAPAPER